MLLNALRSGLGPPYFRIGVASVSLHCRAYSANSMADEVVFALHDHTGVGLMNRPKALNALNLNMVTLLQEQYTKWNQDTNVHCIILKGAGEKAFCAGGDVKNVVLEAMKQQYEGSLQFFRAEYRLNYTISQLKNPHIALLDGITMGGGAGVSMHGTFRVATERTIFAMPECGIGLFPDVGASFFLPRLPGQLGMYLALTGFRLKGVQVKEAALATHFVHSRHFAELEERVTGLGSRAGQADAVADVLESFEGRDAAAASPLPGQLADIDACFAGDTVEEIVAALQARGENEWAVDTLAAMAKRVLGLCIAIA